MRSAGRIRVGLAVATLAIAASGVQLSTPPPASASDGYIETAVTTYTVNPAAGRLDVAIDIVFKNTSASTSTNGVCTEYVYDYGTGTYILVPYPCTHVTDYYFSTLYVWLEHGATSIHATADAKGSEPVVKLAKRGGAYDKYLVNYGVAIFKGQTRKVHLTYQLKSGAPRSTSSIRINSAVASFCVVSTGDDGGTTKVVAPSAYDMSIDATGGELTSTTAGATTVWTTGKMAKPYDFWACFNGANPDGFTATALTSPSGREIDLQAWPVDPTWNTEVKTEVDSVLAKLEALVGRGLPGSGPITVREVASGDLGPYAGLFDPKTGLARVGEDFGSGGVVAHELSHAWFNDSLFDGRWLSEGSAEWARISVVPDTCPQPGTYPGGGTPQLGTWKFAGPRSPQSDLDIVDYEYAAACYIVSTVATKMGPDRMRTVLASLMDHTLAYQGGAASSGSGRGPALAGADAPAGWRQWLDAVDELGLVPAGVTDLDFAQDLLHTYGVALVGSQLDARSKARAAYHALAGSIGDWALPEAILRPMAEWQFDAAMQGIGHATAIYASVRHADAALPGSGLLDGPVKDLFEAATTEADLAAVETKAADQAAAADLVADVTAKAAAPRDVLTQIGLLGSDTAAPLAAAAAGAAAADLPTTRTNADQVLSILAGASQQGVTRLGIAVAVALVVLLLLVFLVRRRRRGRRLALAAVAMAEPAPAGIEEPPPGTT